MLEQLLSQDEGKTLEFKENASSLPRIVQTVIAFANTAGGTLIIGVRDKTKEVVGLDNILKDEERLANAISDSIAPQILPQIQFHTWRDRDVMIISVSHSLGPYYLKLKGENQGVYVRFGSTNRLADPQTIAELKRLREHRSFDELPRHDCSLKEIDFQLAKKLFAEVSRKFTDHIAKAVGLIAPHHDKEFPTNGAILLFAKSCNKFFPDANIRLGRFAGTTKAQIIDQQQIDMPLVIALEPCLAFIQRHTSLRAEFGGIRRQDIPEYPAAVVREAVINALLHADYSIKGASIQIAIFDDRLEITSPGGLPFGLSLEKALSGISQLRNHVIGRIFRELKLIEQWGSGLTRMREICEQQGIVPPKFEEVDRFFRTTLYSSFSDATKGVRGAPWQILIIEYLINQGAVTVKKAQELWQVTHRTASSRLKKMCAEGILAEIATSTYDPQKTYILRQPRN